MVHVHFRNQEPGKGHLPSWDPQVARDCVQAMREACPGLIINQTTGVVGPNYQGPLDCLRATRPEMAACNAGSLNYLKVRSNGTWAWPPMLENGGVPSTYPSVIEPALVMRSSAGVGAACAAAAAVARHRVSSPMRILRDEMLMARSPEAGCAGRV